MGSRGGVANGSEQHDTLESFCGEPRGPSASALRLWPERLDRWLDFEPWFLYLGSIVGPVQDAARPAGGRNARAGDRYARAGQSFFGNHFLAGLEPALCGATGTEQRRAPKIAARAAAGTNFQRACGAHRRFRSHGELGRPALGPAARTSLRRDARRARRDRAAPRRHALAALSRPLLATEPVPRRAAIGKSFRPTACRPCRSKTKAPHHHQNQIQSASRPPLEEALEADISIRRKTGHFYFALTHT